MALPLVLRLLLLAVGTSCLRLNGDDDAEDFPSGRLTSQRHRTGQQVARSPTGRRYIYIAGVPGTGMAYWKGALRRCTQSKRCQPRDVDFYSRVFFSEEVLVNETWVQEDAQQSDRIIPMNLVSPDPSLMGDSAFYHLFASTLTGVEDPRLPLYSRLAESNGDSMKVVVLTRDSARELLAYNMREFQLSAEEADERLAEEIHALASQVSELPVDSYRCMSFEDTMNLGENLEPLVKLGDSGTKAFALKRRLKTAKKYGCKVSGHAVQGCPRFDFPARKVREALDKLEDLCDPDDFVLSKGRREVRVNSGKKIQWLVE